MTIEEIREFLSKELENFSDDEVAILLEALNNLARMYLRWQSEETNKSFQSDEEFRY
jgi:IS30 family transposase